MAEIKEPDQLLNLALVTGGARSGKSAFAEKFAAGISGHVVYIATMNAGGADGELSARIQRHRSRRPESWQTLEESIELPARVEELGRNTSVCLIDCLSLWLANLLPEIDHTQIHSQEFSRQLLEIEQQVAGKTDQLLQSISLKPGVQFVLVTNEVGSAIVPDNVIARLYRDLLGTMNQVVARRASRVWLSCVGLQIVLK